MLPANLKGGLFFSKKPFFLRAFEKKIVDKTRNYPVKNVN